MPNRSATQARVQARARSRDPQQNGRSHHQARTWGTRFDSLTSPPGSPRSNTSRASISPTSSHSSSRSRSFSPPRSHRVSTSVSMQSDEFSSRGPRRDWADDDVPATLYTDVRDAAHDANETMTSADSASIHSLNQSGNTYFGKRTSTTKKMPHNASVFIGSLPSDVEEAELAGNLAAHLGPTANVQSIKIIHDSKGSVCAFVQCETAAQASLVVSRAHTDPQPFMGRMLRYESARARRSLWVSYRMPIHFLPCASQNEEGVGIVTDENGVKGRWIESDLPDAMRIWKPREARFPVISYRGEARNAGELSRFDVDIPNSTLPPAFTLRGMLFVDLAFDGNTIKRMAECFGPLESFKLFSSGEDALTYPPEHDSDRCPGMDSGVWEIKWGHRDDCITALNTLKRVPHLTVTWAKDQNYTYTPRPGYMRSPISPHYPPTYSPREAMSPSFRQRPPLLLDCQRNDRVNGGMSPLSASPTFTRSPLHAQRPVSRISPTLVRRGGEPMQRANEGEDMEEGWTVVRPQNITRTIMSSFSGGPGNVPAVLEVNLKEGLSKSPEWSDRDFPPLKNVHGATDEKEKLESDEKVDEQSRIGDLPASLNDPSNPVSSSQGIEKDDLASADVPKTTSVSRPSVVHRRSLSNPVARMQSQSEIPPQEINSQIPASPAIRALEIPPTPELKNSSIETPTTATTAQLPTPAYSIPMPLPPEGHIGMHKMQEVKGPTQQFNEDGTLTELDSTSGHEHHHEPTIDPKTIFVGGLETLGPQPWTEDRLRSIFEKYGNILEVHIVVPTTKKTAFAFITFADEQGPLQAIREEHNRVYDGRQIRVQIRDMFPPRGGYKFRSRGIMRPRMGFDPHNIDQNQYQNTGRQDRVTIPVFRGHTFEHYTDRAEARQAAIPFRINTHLPPSFSTETDSTLRSSGSYISKPDLDSSQESDTKTAVSLTPPPSTLGSSVSNTAIVAPVTPQGISPAYYPPQAWPYGTQMHYPLHLGSYGGIVQPLPLPYAPAPQGLDPNGTSAPLQWNHMYRAAVPFAPYPYMVVPQTEAARSAAAAAASQSTNPVKNQPPLHATGFIQGEHGTLIPVYQPDALDEYMNNSTSVTGQVVGGSASAPVSTQQSGSIFTAPMWPGYTAPPMIAYPVQPAVASVNSTSPVSHQQQTGSHQAQHTGQMHSQGFANAYVQPGLVPASHNMQQGTVTIGQPQYSQPHATVVSPTGPSMRNNIHHPHMSQHSSNITHERQNNYVNKHPPRRDPNFNNQNNRMHNSVHGPQSPGARPSSRMGNAQRHQHNSGGTTLYSQRQYQQRQGASPLQLTYNKQVADSGPSQHQWVANFQHNG